MLCCGEKLPLRHLFPQGLDVLNNFFEFFVIKESYNVVYDSQPSKFSHLDSRRQYVLTKNDAVGPFLLCGRVTDRK